MIEIFLQPSIQTLPTELIVAILRFLPDKDIQSSILLINKKFYKVVSEFYVDNLYGKTLRFESWQVKQQIKFSKSLDKLK